MERTSQSWRSSTPARCTGFEPGRWRAASLALAAAVLVAWAGASGCAHAPRAVVLTQDQLQNSLASRFPVERAKLRMHVTLGRPVVRLDAEKQDVVVELVSVVRYLDHRVGANVIQVRGRPEYIPEGGTFHIAKPVVEYVETPVLPLRLKALYRIIISDLVGMYIDTFPFHELAVDPEGAPLNELRQTSAKVREGALHLTLTPR